MDNAQLLVELELLLTRLYSPECSNQERVDISKTLEEFSHRANIWKHCIYILQNSNNEYLILYGLNVIERLIVQSWSTVTLEDRMSLKQFILEYLIRNFSMLPSFFRNKLVHLFVLIGRSDWPNPYHDFLDNILELSKSEDTRLLCLSLIQTTSEELATPKTDTVSSKREKELISSLLNYVPSVIELITNILSAGLWLHPLYSGQSSYNQTTSSIPDSLFMLQLPVNILNSSLNCINHILSWIPLSADMPPVKLVNIIFQYASLGCLSGSDSSGECGELGALAMDCINELLIKNCVPNELEVFLTRLYEHSFNLLQQLTTTVPGGRNIDFARLDDRYLSKCGDFFDYFVNSHLKRVEFNTNFPVLDFLSLFYKYTFKQPEIDSFCVSLMTWNVFLDHLLLTEGNRPPTMATKHSERYKEILITMTASILEKIQFHCNNIELSNIDDDTIDENETEWQSFLRQNLEFVGKVAELFPEEVLQMTVPLLDEYSKVYLSLSQLITQQGKGRYLSVSDGGQCKTLHAVLKDLTTVLQAIGRLSEHFSGENFINRLEQSQKLMNKFCIIAKYSTANQLFNVETPVPEVLDQGFIEVHCQVLGTILAYHHWLSQFHLFVLQGKANQEILQYFVLSALEAAIPLVSHDIPEKIALSGCKLFESIITAIRSPFLSEYSIVQDLLVKACSRSLDPLPIPVSVMVYRSIVSLLVLPWINITDESQEWDKRYSKLKTVMDRVLEPYYQYITNTQFQQSIALQEEAKPVIKKTMFILQQVMSSFPHEGKKSKKIFYLSIRSSVVESVPLICVYINEPDILEQLMSFFYIIFKTFHAQIDGGLTNEVTQIFMTLLTKDHLESTILEEGSIGNTVVIRFIDVLKLLIQDVSNSDRVLLPNVISFALKQLYPVLKNKDAPELKLSFYSLLFHLLFDNWRYFYSSNILAQMNTNIENIQHEDDLAAIMEAFGQSFVEADINVFRENIVALKILNEKKKLFFKANFRSTMWEPFLNVFIQVLMQKSHSLLQDEISELIYQLASVDFMHFHSEFFPKFIGNILGLTQQQKLSLVENYQIVEDHPSFTQSLSNLTMDVRFYLTQNRTLLN